MNPSSSNVPTFAIDSAPLTLTGTDSAARPATGGTPPYSYASSDPGIVRVPDAAKGDITAVADGTVIITASDSAGHQGSYRVEVTGNKLTVDAGYGGLGTFLDQGKGRGNP